MNTMFKLTHALAVDLGNVCTFEGCWFTPRPDSKECIAHDKEFSTDVPTIEVRPSKAVVDAYVASEDDPSVMEVVPV